MKSFELLQPIFAKAILLVRDGSFLDALHHPASVLYYRARRIHPAVMVFRRSATPPSQKLNAPSNIIIDHNLLRIFTRNKLPDEQRACKSCPEWRNLPSMILLIRLLTISLLLSASFSTIAADYANSSQIFNITTPPAELKLPAFYKKYISANGYPIVSSGKVNDYALKEAAYLINMMLAKRPDVRKAMIKSCSRMIVMAHDEFTSDVPEHSKLRPTDYWDARARGLGGSKSEPVCSCAEENILAFEGDPYSTENILIHEFAHNIHLRGMVNVDKTFDKRLKATYENAIAAGLWESKYASVNHAEYFAEGVQSWFDNNRKPDHDHNHVDTRTELKEYDPGLAAVCEEVFGDTELVYTKPTTRLHGHLKGYDPSKSPKFVWPERLNEVKREIREKAKARGKNREKTYVN